MKRSTYLLAAALATVAIFFGNNVKAQTTPANAFRLGVGLETGIPTGDASVSSNFEIGGTARLQYGITNSFALTLTSGYYDMIGKKDPGTNFTYRGLQVIPIKAGIKEFFTSNLYVGAEAGVAVVTTKDGHTKLDLSPALGYANKSWDIGVRYENFSGENSSYGLVGLRIAYGFGL